MVHHLDISQEHGHLPSLSLHKEGYHQLNS